eukprot:2574752-Pyramimonas_sp.AAC.1
MRLRAASGPSRREHRRGAVAADRAGPWRLRFRSAARQNVDDVLHPGPDGSTDAPDPAGLPRPPRV